MVITRTLTPDDLSILLDIPLPTIYHYLKYGYINSVKIGTRYRVTMEEYERIKKEGISTKWGKEQM